MARRRNRKREQGLFEIATRSDWKLSAGIAAASLFIGLVLIPAFFAGNPLLAPMAGIFSTLAVFFALGFAGIALIRYFKQASAGFAARADGRKRAAAGNSNQFAEAVTMIAPVPQAAKTKPEPPPPPPRPQEWSLDVLDRIEWKRFEDLCCAFYCEKGIRAQTTRLGADGGIDIHLFQDEADPARATSIVQCKAWSKPVGVREMRELRGVMAHEKVDKAFFMAPNGYTDEARAFATENRITLLDGKLFLAMLQRLPEETSKRLLDFATEGDWTTPTCPSCGDRMTARQGKWGPFWGCVSYPKCHAKLGMRTKSAAPRA